MKKAKTTTNFVCQECGYDSPSWLGKCPECGEWNSLKEFHMAKGTSSRAEGLSPQSAAKPQTLKEIVYSEKLRMQTDFTELNNVLGGGIVAGSVTLIAGDPGVGKSTLLLQLALSLAVGRQQSADNGLQLEKDQPPNAIRKVLYVSGEESVEQIKMRAERIIQSLSAISGQRLAVSKGQLADNGLQLEKDQPPNAKSQLPDMDNLLLLAMTDTDAIVGQIESVKPDLVIVDSIQTIESQNVSGLSGSVGQVRYSALQFVRTAKALNVPIIIVGHVTKEGMVAGPMVLSHMVDTVLFLEGEKFAKTRILRSLKNRFGPVDEVGIFLMEEEGMTEAKNPEQLFLTRSAGSGQAGVPGSVLVSTLEGSRAFLVELQALTVATKLPMPRRVVSGVDPRRVELLLAVLQKHCRLPLDSTDVFVNVAGGMKLADPAIDLGICLAVYSSLKNIALDKVVGISEVGLLGELRMVNGLEKRKKEAEKMGFKRVITPKTHKTLSEVIGGLK